MGIFRESSTERELGWWENLRVFWSISWPAWTVGMFLAMEAAAFWLPTSEELLSQAFAVGVLFQGLYFTGHILLIPRMTRKRYRHFRLTVVRHDGSASPLMLREWIPVVWRIVLPQLLLLVVVSVAANMLALAGDAQILRSISSLGRLVHLFGVGPLAVKYALERPYGHFRFRAESTRL